MGKYDVHRIRLSMYSPEWKKMFQGEKEKLLRIFGTHLITFHHIGSTAIPNCEAKPIIDILGITNDVLQIDQFNSSLEKAGYIPLGEYGMKQRRFFRKRESSSVHLHIFEDSDPETARHLRFRDFLTAHPEETKEYSRLKQQLVAADPSDMAKYILGKENFIKNIDRRAALEDTGSYWNKIPYPRKAIWSQSEIINAMDANMQLEMTYFSKYLFELQLLYEPDVTVVRSSLHNDTFNYVIAARFNEKNVSQRVSHVLELFRSQQLPFTWWVSERDTPHFLEKELIAQGLSFKEDDVGMSLLLDQKKFLRTIPALVIQRVFEQKALQDFATVMTSLGSYEDIYEQFFSKIPQVLYGEGSPYEMYVGDINGTPLVTGILVFHANVAGIHYVITNPSHRKKGYRTEMMIFLLKRAQEKGYHVSTLQASSSGRSLYQRLGFQQNCRFVEYS